MVLQDTPTAGACHDIELGALVFKALDMNTKFVIADEVGNDSQP